MAAGENSVAKNPVFCALSQAPLEPREEGRSLQPVRIAKIRVQSMRFCGTELKGYVNPVLTAVPRCSLLANSYEIGICAEGPSNAAHPLKRMASSSKVRFYFAPRHTGP
jgi:hypothetical protein